MINATRLKVEGKLSTFKATILASISLLFVIGVISFVNNTL